jgi:drug/metabolite transporter (DMT)-like permease
VQVVLALISALLFAVGTVLQQKAGMDVLASGTSSALLVRMARHRLWLVGIAFDIGGFVAQATALRLGQLAVVQPLLILSVVLALPLGARLSDQHVGWREAAAAALVVAALAGFLAIANPSGGRSEASLSKWVVAGVACAAVCAPLSILGRQGPAPRRAALLGAAAGILFALSAALIKSVVDELHLGVVHVITSWELYALVGVGYVSMTLNQLSLNTRALAATLASSTTLDPVVSVALGLALFDEHLHASALQAAVGLVALAAALLGVVVLAWAEVPNTIATS